MKGMFGTLFILIILLIFGSGCTEQPMAETQSQNVTESQQLPDVAEQMHENASETESHENVTGVPEVTESNDEILILEKNASYRIGSWYIILLDDGLGIEYINPLNEDAWANALIPQNPGYYSFPGGLIEVMDNKTIRVHDPHVEIEKNGLNNLPININSRWQYNGRKNHDNMVRFQKAVFYTDPSKIPEFNSLELKNCSNPAAMGRIDGYYYYVIVVSDEGCKYNTPEDKEIPFENYTIYRVFSKSELGEPIVHQVVISWNPTEVYRGGVCIFRNI